MNRMYHGIYNSAIAKVELMEYIPRLSFRFSSDGGNTDNDIIF
jgi:hypothetical protein